MRKKTIRKCTFGIRPWTVPWSVIVSLALELGMLFTIQGWGASTGYGSISGTLQDKHGAVLSLVRISVFEPESGRLEGTTVSTETGQYQVTNLPFGKHMLLAEKKGFVTFYTEVTLQPAQASPVNATLDTENGFEPASACGFLCKAANVFLEVATLGSHQSAPPPPAPPPLVLPSQPVYNALLSPSWTADGVGVRHLKSGQDAKLTFYIGSLDPKNVLPVSAISLNQQIADSKIDVPLEVTFACQICSQNSVQQQQITYSAVLKQSAQIAFTFTPNIGLVQDGNSQLSLEVDNDRGVRMAHLVIDVAVDETDNPGRIMPNVIPQPLGMLVQPAPTGNEPDVIIAIWKNPTESLSLTVTASNPDLDAKFQGKNRESDKLRVFETGNFRVDNIRDASKQTALVMKEFVDHSAPVAQTLLGGPPDNPITLDRDTLKLSDEDKNNLLRAFYKFGSYVHFKLFNDADPDLVFIIQQLEAFNPQDHVPRVLIRTTNIAFPWQILHVPQPMDGGANDNVIVEDKDFWGVKFDLSIDSLGRRNSGLPPSRVLATTGSSFMFGAYRAEVGASTNDTLVKRLAKQQAEFAKTTLKFNNSFIDNKRSDFMTHLKQHNQEVTFLGIFAHGSSGWIVVDLPQGIPTILQEAEGPRVMLAVEEPVTPSDIENLPVGRVSTAAAFLEKHPVVLLNACETGVAPAWAVDGSSLPIALLNVGAAGVVAPEAPVWVPFAYGFGNDLIQKVSEGAVIPSALRELRKSYLDSRNNPFGLMYSYYGSPTSFETLH